MKLELVKGIQKLFKNIAKNTIGKSFPPGMHERRIPEELKRAVEEERKQTQYQRETAFPSPLFFAKPVDESFFIWYSNLANGRTQVFFLCVKLAAKAEACENETETTKNQVEVEVVRTKITLACTECKQRNYNMTKDKKTHPDRMETKKYCRFCKRHTMHKETK